MGCITSKETVTEPLPRLSVSTEEKEPADGVDETMRLMTMTEDQLSEIKLIPDKFLDVHTFCRFYNFYDGDTATIVFLHDGACTSSKFRFFGYDSPEMKIPKKIVGEARTSAKKAALDAKKFIIDFVADKTLIVHFTKKEKFGRLMGEVYYFPKGNLKPIEEYECTEKNSISALMIANGHGYAYHGGKKVELKNIDEDLPKNPAE